MIKEGSKVVLRDSSQFAGRFSNPEAGAIGVVESVIGDGWFHVEWLSGIFQGKPIKKSFVNSYEEKDLKVIP